MSQSHKYAAELVARCFAARTAAHFAHLSTKSYAAHMALGSFYDDIITAADAFIECYQGVYGLIGAGSFPDVPLPKGEVTPIKELRDWLAEYRTMAALDNTELQNLIDEITAVCDRAIYKLTFLK